MPLPVELHLYHNNKEIKPVEENEESSIEFGNVRPDGKKQLTLTIRNDGVAAAENMRFHIGEPATELENPKLENRDTVIPLPNGEYFIVKDLGVTVDMAPIDLEPEEEKPLVLSWQPDRLVIGRNFLFGNLLVTYDYVLRKV